MRENIKLRIVHLLKEFDTGKYSNILLNDYFNSNALEKSEKGFITEVFYGVIRNRIFVDYIINKFTNKIKKKELFYLFEISVYQGIFMESDIPGVVWEAGEIVKKKYGAGLLGFANGVLRNIFRESEKIIESLKQNNRYDILLSYKEWQYKKITEIYGNEAVDIMRSYKMTPFLSIRVNKLKYSEVELNEYLKKNNINIKFKFESVYYIDSGEILNSELFKSGKIIAQDGSSYLAAKILNPQENENVLDACAAPGSKTVLLAEIMKNIGKIYALDIHEHKIELIRENIKKTGADIIEPVLCDATKTELKFTDGSFDKILADVPCTGFGVIRKKPEVIYTKDEKSINEIQKLQRNILESVSKLLKVNGNIVYSTCTIFEEENTQNIKWFLKNNTNFIVEPIVMQEDIEYTRDCVGGIQVSYKNRYLDGFYIIKLKRVI